MTKTMIRTATCQGQEKRKSQRRRFGDRRFEFRLEDTRRRGHGRRREDVPGFYQGDRNGAKLGS